MRDASSDTFLVFGTNAVNIIIPISFAFTFAVISVADAYV